MSDFNFEDEHPAHGFNAVVNPDAFSELDVGKTAANVWMHEAGPAAQASWPTSHANPEDARRVDALADAQYGADPAPPTPIPGIDDPEPLPGEGGAGGPQGAPGVRRHLGGGGGGYGTLTPKQHYFPPGYPEHLKAKYSDEAINKRWDARMGEWYAKRWKGEITEEEFAKHKAEADKARDGEKAEHAKEVAKWEAWRNSPVGREMEIARMGYAQQDRAAQSRQEQLKAQQWASQMQYGAQQRMMRESEKAQKEYAQQKAEHDEAYEREMGKYQGAIKELEAKKVDPNRYWKNKSVMQSFMAIMGAGLLGAAGKPELALQNIQAGIKNDLDAQMADIETAKSTVASRKQLLGFMREKYGDLERARTAAEGHAYRKFANRVRLYAAKADTDSKQAQMHAMADMLDMEAGKREALLEHQARTIGEQEMLMRARARAGAAAQRAKAAQLEAHGYELSHSDMKNLVPGVGLALPGSDVKELRNASADLVGKTRLVRQARALLAKAGKGAVLTPAEKNVLVAVQSQLQTPEIKKIAGASMTDAEMDRIMPGIGGEFSDWSARNYGGADKMLGNYERHLRATTREKFGAHVQQGQTHEYVDEKGKARYRFKPALGMGTKHNTASIQPKGQ